MTLAVTNHDLLAVIDLFVVSVIRVAFFICFSNLTY